MRIFGGAGTRKTVVTVHRAAALAERDAKNGQDVSVLLTTYTRNLADDLKRQLAEGDRIRRSYTGPIQYE